MNKFLKCIASIPYHILRCLKVIVGTCGILVNPTPVEPDRRLEAPPTDEEFAEFLENVKEEITWEEIIDLSLNGL